MSLTHTNIGEWHVNENKINKGMPLATSQEFYGIRILLLNVCILPSYVDGEREREKEREREREREREDILSSLKGMKT